MVSLAPNLLECFFQFLVHALSGDLARTMTQKDVLVRIRRIPAYQHRIFQSPGISYALIEQVVRQMVIENNMIAYHEIGERRRNNALGTAQSPLGRNYTTGSSLQLARPQHLP